MVLAKAARRINGFATKRGGQSGTYVDDFVVSGPGTGERTVAKLREIIEQEGFEINSEKTRLIGREDEQVVGGIRVNDGFDAPSKKIKETRTLIENTFSDRQVSAMRQESRVKSIRGKIGFISGFNPGAAKTLRILLDRQLHSERD